MARASLTEMLPDTGKKWRDFERLGLEIRRFAGISVNERLNPSELAETLRLKVVMLDKIDNLSDSVKDQLAGGGWSGGSIGPLPDGTRVILINNRQSKTRQAATLMEEICHVLLGHEPSKVTDKERSYSKNIEEEAYGVGAAALVPYFSLADLLSRGETASRIARHFGVSTALVEYRMKILGLWKKDF